MKRFRFTLLAICLVLLYLGWTDVDLFLRNRTPQNVTIDQLERQGAPREWLTIQGGYQDLTQAISTSGSIELDALLIPLKRSPEATDFRVLVETRDPRILELFRTYNFQLESVDEQKAFYAKHAAEFRAQRDVTGTVITGVIARGNRDKLLELATQVGLPVAEDVIFLSEGKEIASFRGFFFLIVGLAGLIKGLLLWKKPAGQTPT